ncbi:pyruvate kinase [Clostridium felsineum]|uniref:Pyruvate kinase n=1 Tax=Clostridium felsineum TaxID=36839 RepID=A0A1S8L8N8_9CLOT|nr:pyruvate kinase [Clostridium felsineum]MCR3760527.1 pyruvate kinase [Clostridium felsineum]URZ02096.1 Pyruvate kinase [Clostridium felsineum]URZ05134.1 Pyruvate kinase [Clostridium felsineum]URZ10175.1 Pyruvate kinase [Clostridium felsineum]URZ17929.1 Pyruvate kinase [Clostridium felsineum DSM 794]
MQKTKMIFTVGPASETEEIVTAFVKAGMNASRHNFSHGDHAEHGGRIALVKKVREKLNKPVAICLDTKGPEIRTGDFNPSKLELQKGSKFTIHCGEEIVGDATKCSISYKDLYKDVKKGNTILIDDGLVGLTVEAIEGTNVVCTVANTGLVGSHKGVNVPNVSIQLPAMTDKDKGDLIFGCQEEIDMVSASFIRKPEDVIAIRKVLDENGGDHIQIFSKIENQEGVDNIDAIIEVSDGIMVARGDMGVEIPIQRVPLIQKMIIKKCNAAGKPVITATQMLDSMMRNPRPTRAEASDIANAIFDGTDAIMLSGESANGTYPIEAVTTMAKIAQEAEKEIDYDKFLADRKANEKKNTADVISFGTCTAATDLNAAAIITATQTGNTARTVSKYRPQAPVIAVTPSEKVARKLAMSWGVHPIISDKFGSTDELIATSVEKAKEADYVKKGDLVVVAAGVPTNVSGTTNMLKVHVVE